MARKTIKVSIEIKKPQDFSKLVHRILEKHKEMGKSSPLKSFINFNEKDLSVKLSKGDAARHESETLKKKSESKMEDARKLYGTAAGQNITTPGTVYHDAAGIRKFLLSYYEGQEEKLSEFGFDVVIGSAKSPGNKKIKKP